MVPGSSLIQRGWLASKSQGLTCLCLPSTKFPASYLCDSSLLKEILSSKALVSISTPTFLFLPHEGQWCLSHTETFCTCRRPLMRGPPLCLALLLQMDHEFVPSNFQPRPFTSSRPLGIFSGPHHFYSKSPSPFPGLCNLPSYLSCQDGPSCMYLWVSACACSQRDWVFRGLQCSAVLGPEPTHLVPTQQCHTARPTS